MPDMEFIRLIPRVRAVTQQAYSLVEDAGAPELTELRAALLTLQAAQRNVLDTVRALRQMRTSTGQDSLTPLGRRVSKRYSWQAIAEVLGVTRQTAHERFAARLPLDG